MKIIVTNPTGSGAREGSLSKDGGIIVFENGEVSCVQHELSFNRKIMVKKEEKAPVVTEEKKEDAAPTAEQSKKSKKASVK